MIKFLIASSLLISLCISTSAQPITVQQIEEIIDTTTNDSLKAASYYRLAVRLVLQDLPLAINYRDSGYQLFETIENKDGLSEVYYVDGVIAAADGDFAKAIEFSQKHYDWAKEANKDVSLSFAISSLAKYNREGGNLSQAVHFSLEGLSLNERLKNKHDVGYYSAELGNLYSMMKQWDEALIYIQKSHDVAKDIGFPIGQAVSLRNLAENANERLMHDKALGYLSKALTLDSISNYSVGLTRDFRSLGYTYEKLNNYGLAKINYNKALEFIEEGGYNQDKAQAYQGLCRIALKENNIRQALQYYEKSEEFGAQNSSKKFRADLFKIRSEVYEKRGEYFKALSALQKHNAVSDSILNNDIANQIAGLNISYETEQRIKENTILNSKNEIAALKLNTAKRLNYALLLGLGGFALLFFLLYRFYRRNQQQKNIIAQSLNEKDILLKEIHHRVKNNLQFISSLLELQSQHVTDTSALDALQDGQNRVKSMALIHQNLYQEENLMGVQVDEYFEKLVSQLFDSYNIRNEQIHLDLDVQKLNLDVDTLIPLGLIVNELVSNALKYAFPHDRIGRIKVSLKSQNDSLELIVSDDGIGMNDDIQKQLGKSFGYRLINAFTSQLDADFSIDGINGSEIKMTIKDYKQAS